MWQLPVGRGGLLSGHNRAGAKAGTFSCHGRACFDDGSLYRMPHIGPESAFVPVKFSRYFHGGSLSFLGIGFTLAAIGR